MRKYCTRFRSSWNPKPITILPKQKAKSSMGSVNGIKPLLQFYYSSLRITLTILILQRNRSCGIRSIASPLFERTRVIYLENEGKQYSRKLNVPPGVKGLTAYILEVKWCDFLGEIQLVVFFMELCRIWCRFVFVSKCTVKRFPFLLY